jgi:hypothetical protein
MVWVKLVFKARRAVLEMLQPRVSTTRTAA